MQVLAFLAIPACFQSFSLLLLPLLPFFLQVPEQLSPILPSALPSTLLHIVRRKA